MVPSAILGISKFSAGCAIKTKRPNSEMRWTGCEWLQTIAECAASTRVTTDEASANVIQRSEFWFPRLVERTTAPPHVQGSVSVSIFFFLNCNAADHGRAHPIYTLFVSVHCRLKRVVAMECCLHNVFQRKPIKLDQTVWPRCLVWIRSGTPPDEMTSSRLRFGGQLHYFPLELAKKRDWIIQTWAPQSPRCYLGFDSTLKENSVIWPLDGCA